MISRNYLIAVQLVTIFFVALIPPASAERCTLGNGFSVSLDWGALSVISDSGVSIAGIMVNDSAAQSISCGENVNVYFEMNRREELSKLRISGVQRGLVKIELTGGSSAKFQYLDSGENYYGVWEHPVVESLSNRGATAALSTLGETKHLAWANARAPFYFTDLGYGVYVDSEARGHYSFGHVTSVNFDAPTATVYLFAAASEKLLLKQFAALTAASVLPPDWGFGAFFWRNNPHSDSGLDLVDAQQNILGDFERLESLRIRATGTILDRPFMSNEWGWGDRTFSTRFPNPRRLVKDLNQRGVKPILWIANRADGELRQLASNYLFNVSDSRPAINFRNSDRAREVLSSYLSSFVELGFQGFKIDRGDEAEMPEGEMNFHGRAFPELAASVLRRKFKDDHLLIARAPYDRGRAHTVVWSGDPDSTFAGLRYSLLAALRSGLILSPYSGSDTGGFKGQTSKELFLRWLGVSAYTPFLEVLLDQGGQTFWSWADDETILYTKELADRHHFLIPYTRSLLIEGRKTGLPIMRPLFLEYPNDLQARNIYEEYLYGPSLLVAPVIDEGVKIKEVYFPEGSWVDLQNSQRVYTGPSRKIVKAPLGKVPVFHRTPSVVVQGDIVQGNNSWTKNWSPKYEITIVPPQSDGEYRETFYESSEIDIIVTRKGEVVKVSTSRDFAYPVKVKVVCGSEIQGVVGSKAVLSRCRKLKKV